MASPGLPDRDRHPFVGMVVEDLGDGYVDPYCHITLISPTEAVTAHHCAPTGSEVLFTLDNPVVVPAQIHSGTVRVGGWDFENFYVDIAIVDLHEPIDLPRYAQVALESVTYGPGTILDFVTYVGSKQSGLVTPIVVPGIGFLPKATDVQPEPAHVEFDRNLIRTTPKPGAGGYETAETINTTNPTCFGNSGSPIFLKGTDLMTGVLSYGTRYACVGGVNAYFARTDSELAGAILEGTIVEPPPPPPPPPPPTVYPRLVKGSGATGALSFPATVRAGADYTGTVWGLSPANTLVGQVGQDEFAVFPASVSEGFDTFLAVLRDDFTSGNDDLDVFLAWYIDGSPVILHGCNGFTSDEGLVLTNETVQGIVDYYGVDDPYNFDIAVYGWYADGGNSDFSLFTSELATGLGDGNPIVDPIFNPEDPNVTITMTWAALDSTPDMDLGWIEHFIDGGTEGSVKPTVTSIIP